MLLVLVVFIFIWSQEVADGSSASDGALTTTPPVGDNLVPVDILSVGQSITLGIPIKGFGVASTMYCKLYDMIGINSAPTPVFVFIE